eukprot:7517077-Prorocentrum_lima.AAC.1
MSGHRAFVCQVMLARALPVKSPCERCGFVSMDERKACVGPFQPFRTEDVICVLEVLHFIA